MKWIPTVAQTSWFERTIAAHFALHFSPSVGEALRAVGLRFLRYDEISDSTTGGILLPIDIAPRLDGPAIAIRFSDTTLAMVQPLPRPRGSQWHAVEVDGIAVWWRNPAGAMMPAWNLYGVCAALLLAFEELDTTAQDAHERFPVEESARSGNGLLERPTVNEAFALIAAALCAIQRRNEQWFDLHGLVLSPLLFLSHDCDNLSGNGFWLQASRVARFFLHLARTGKADWRQLRWMFKGMRTPRAGFADEVGTYMQLEKAHGFFSRFYFVNGTGGRFGARSSLSRTVAVAREIRPPHEIGLHYNYDTWRDEKALARQAHALRDRLGISLKAGRAHYLRLDAARSPRIWERTGIRLDESFGSPEVPLYRLGFAGVFQWFDLGSDRALALAECPLIFMDSAIAQRWPQDPLAGLLTQIRHIAAIGGSVSVIFHPGLLENPEFQDDPSFYARFLGAMRDLGARQCTTSEATAALGISDS